MAQASAVIRGRTTSHLACTEMEDPFIGSRIERPSKRFAGCLSIPGCQWESGLMSAIRPEWLPVVSALRGRPMPRTSARSPLDLA